MPGAAPSKGVAGASSGWLSGAPQQLRALNALLVCELLPQGAIQEQGECGSVFYDPVSEVPRWHFSHICGSRPPAIAGGCGHQGPRHQTARLAPEPPEPPILTCRTGWSYPRLRGRRRRELCGYYVPGTGEPSTCRSSYNNPRAQTGVWGLVRARLSHQLSVGL